MNNTHPPLLATWMLKHCIPGDRDEALTGDLFEEFCGGRSTGWYWRQVMAAIASGCLRELRTGSLALVFAALWTIPAQAWWSFALWPASHYAGFILPRPYSFSLGAAIVVFQSLWAGLALYGLLCSPLGRNLTPRGVGRGFWMGPVVFSVLTITIQIVSHPLGIAQGSRSTLKLVTFFLSCVAATWGIRSPVLKRSQPQALQK